MLATRGCGNGRFIGDGQFGGVHFFFLGGTPRWFWVNAVDKGVRKRFGVKAVDKELSVASGKSLTQSSPRSAAEGAEKKYGAREFALVKKRKELGAIAGARTIGIGDFTGNSSAG
jgi:hypothetical protein